MTQKQQHDFCVSVLIVPTGSRREYSGMLTKTWEEAPKPIDVVKSERTKHGINSHLGYHR